MPEYCRRIVLKILAMNDERLERNQWALMPIRKKIELG